MGFVTSFQRPTDRAPLVISRGLLFTPEGKKAVSGFKSRGGGKYGEFNSASLYAR